jgi:hypothetical protein
MEEDMLEFSFLGFWRLFLFAISDPKRESHQNMILSWRES